MIHYFAKVGIALSVLFNVILGGQCNQTFSARNYEWKRKGKPNLVKFIDFLFFTEKHHCLTSWVYWAVRQ